MTGTPVEPTLDTVRQVLEKAANLPNPPNLVPLSITLSSEFQTPASLYLKLTARSKSKKSFLFESAATTETIGRFSFVGADPHKILTSGPGYALGEQDPLLALSDELSQFRVAQIPYVKLPPLIGGGIGYIGYDCVKYFEPRTRRDLKDVLEVPESLFMLFDTIVAVDHFYQVLKVFTYLKVPGTPGAEQDLETAYEVATRTIQNVVAAISVDSVPLPPQGPINLNQEYTSNIGEAGYKAFVTKLKDKIKQGEIIQAVPSQRIARPTSLHPFNVYRRLRTVNPSPYLFFCDCEDFQIIGASPEVLVKSEQGRIITHPIAGTIRRGATTQEDDALAKELRNSIKDRAEHVMLVDLARNDVNRVCDPLSTRVDRLMIVQRFSHVQHITSEVSGVLRPDKSRFDAFRSIFPAGTVSGAPKVRAMELIADLEKEKRGVYAGAVGYFGYNTVLDGQVEEGAMDTCIALRTMVQKDGVVYLQAGGGIVFDSDPQEEYVETINKLKANMSTLDSAEANFAAQMSSATDKQAVSSENGTQG